MPFSSAENVVHWRERAVEARRLAYGASGPVECEHMLSTARIYDRLAEMAEKRETRATPSPKARVRP